MNFKDLQKELKAIKGVSNLSLIRQNVIKIDLEKSVSKAFFTDESILWVRIYNNLVPKIKKNVDFLMQPKL